MSTKPVESDPIDGKIYCNLRSTFPYVFVDAAGNQVGEPLRYVSTSLAKQLIVKVAHREVTPIEAATSGLDYELDTTMRYFIREKRLSRDLKEHIVHCQRKQRIDYIVVDSDVLEAARIERSLDPSFTLRKLFMPMIHDIRFHKFYKYGIAGLISSAVKNQLIIDNPSQYHLDRVDMR